MESTNLNTEVLGSADNATNKTANEKKYDIPQGLTKMQRKNQRRTLREKKKKQEQTEDNQTVQKKKKQITDPHQIHRERIYRRILNSLKTIEQNTSNSPSLDTVKAQLQKLEKLIEELLEANLKLNIEMEVSNTRNMNYGQMLKQYEYLSEIPDADEEDLLELEEQLTSILITRNARKMQAEFTDLLKKLESKKQSLKNLVNQGIQNQRVNVVVDRVKSVLLKKDPKIKVDSIVTSENVTSQKVPINANILRELLPPSSILNSIRLRHGVYFNKVTEYSTFLLVSGLKESVQKIVKFFQNADFSGKYTLVTDAKLIPSIIGPQGSNIHKLEEKYDCFIRVSDTTLRIIGVPENAATALTDLKKAVEEKQHETTIKERVDFVHPALGQGLLAKFLQHLHEIENSCGVRIRIVHNDSEETYSKEDGSSVDDTKKTSFAYIIGKHKNIKKGIEAFNEFLNNLKITEIKAKNPVAINRLFEKFSRGSTSTYHHAYAQQFRRMMLAADKTAFVKQPDSIVIISQSETPTTYIESIEQLLTNVSYEPVQYQVSKETLFVFNNKVISSIELSTNTTIQKLSTYDNYVSFEIIGDPESQLKASAAMDSILSNKGIIETLPRSTFSNILHVDKFKSKIRSIEISLNIRIIIEPDQEVLKIIGSQACIDKAKEELQQLNEAKTIDHVNNEERSNNNLKRSSKQQQTIKSQVQEEKRTDQDLVSEQNLSNDNSFPPLSETTMFLEKKTTSSYNPRKFKISS